jgi:hypothetical protein
MAIEIDIPALKFRDIDTQYRKIRQAFHDSVNAWCQNNLPGAKVCLDSAIREAWILSRHLEEKIGRENEIEGFGI